MMKSVLWYCCLTLYLGRFVESGDRITWKFSNVSFVAAALCSTKTLPVYSVYLGLSGRFGRSVSVVDQ